MGFIKLELRCPKSAAMVSSADPKPLWSLHDLFSELNSLEVQLGSCNSTPSSLRKFESSFVGVKGTGTQSNKPFVMRISENDSDKSDSEDDISSCNSTTGARFACHDVYLSDSEGSDDEIRKKPTHLYLLEKKSPEEGILFELESEHQLMVKEQVRSKLSVLELSQKNEMKESSLAVLRLEEYTKARMDMDRRLDKQYQRRIAEVLDKHLSILQRNHAQRSQIEERRIRDDAALEEFRRKEKALIEDRLHQEKAKADAEARLNTIKQAEAQKAAVEAERRAAKEAAEKEAAEKEAARIRETGVTGDSKREATDQKGRTTATTARSIQQANSIPKDLGIRIIASDAALKAEANWLSIYEEVARKSKAISQKEIDRHGRQMYKYIKQIGGTVENVRAKAHILVQIIKDPAFPLPVSVMIFANKVVSLSENPSGSFDKSAFACGWVILHVASQVPNVMDLLLPEFHKACIYTVPKHLQASDASSQTKDYWKMVGYREEDGKMESTNDFLNRVESCMKLYASLIQTEIDGIKNPYGLQEGWSWLAMFLNKLPANRTTAVALEAFLKMAGFALHKKYKSQFKKVLHLISTRFLPALKQRGEAVNDIVVKLEQYLDDKCYLNEPEGRRLQGSTVSRYLV